MSGVRSNSGLVCSHGSELDTLIPRPKMPKCALPPELRRKMGLAPRKEETAEENKLYEAGAGVLAKVGSGRDGSFLKRRSGVPMSERTSEYNRINGVYQGNRANISRAHLANGESNALLVKVREVGKENSRKRTKS